MPTVLHKIGSTQTGLNTHASLAAFATWLIGRDLVANNEVLDVRVYEDQPSINALIIAPQTYSATCYCVIQPAAGLGVNDIDPTGAAGYGTSGIELTQLKSGSSVTRLSHGVSLQGFRISITATTAGYAFNVARTANDTAHPNGVFNAELKGNRVKGQLEQLGTGIIGTTAYASSSRITDNMFFSTGPVEGFLETGYGLECHRNTFIASGLAAGLPIMESRVAGIRLEDNVFSNCGATPVRLTVPLTYSNNNFADVAITGTSTGFTVASPLIESPTNPRPSVGSPLIGAGSVNAKFTYDAAGQYRGASPDIGGLMRVAATAAAPINATITEVTVSGQSVTISGTFAGDGVSGGTATLVPATTPNGAVTVSSGVVITGYTFSVTFSGVTPGNYGVPTVSLNSPGGAGTSTGGTGFAIAVPVAPTVVINSQSKAGTAITISGSTTAAVSGAVTLPAAAIPNGAVTKGPINLSIDSAGNFTVILSSLSAGSYDAPIITVQNTTGTGTVSGEPMMIYLAGSQPPGVDPAVVLPPYVAPTFSSPSVPVDSEVTDITFTNTASSVQNNIPFTFAQPFKAGELAPNNFLVGKIAGAADVPLQFNVKSTHQDGSIRHAIISGVLPTLAAGSVKIMSLVRSASSAANTISKDSALVRLSVYIELLVDSVTYRADTFPTLATTLTDTITNGNGVWLGGSIANEYVVMVPFIDIVSGAAHPYLTAQFSIRAYEGLNRAKIDFTVEHTKAYLATMDISYSGELRIAGTAVDLFNITHFPQTRWKKSMWWNGAPTLDIQHNRRYFVDTKAVPNYDTSVIMEESRLVKYADSITYGSHAPMGKGLYNAFFGQTGAAPGIGLLPEWQAATIISTDPRAKAVTLASADISGSFGIHNRDVSAGPFKTRPLSVIYWPKATILGVPGDANNSATGKNEKLPAVTTVSTYQPDSSHQPNMAYLSYLMTGDYYYLEEMQFWSAWNVYRLNPGYRGGPNGDFTGEQVRGQAWNFRGMAEVAAITPDNDPYKTHFNFWLANSLNAYHAEYTDNPNANPLHVMDAVIYTVGSLPKLGIGNFQDDFNVQALNHVNDLGFTGAGRFLLWKVKYQVDRLIGAGMCFTDACVYAFRVRETETSPYYTTMALAYEKTKDAYGAHDIWALPCNSQERLDLVNARRALPSNPIKLNEITGISYGEAGFVANYQPAIAAAVDVGFTDADLAWSLFDGRSVKPNYGLGPQFAIIPRNYIYVAPPAATVTQVDVYPPEATVLGDGTANFSAGVTGTNSPSQSVTWSIVGGGSINNGDFIAPAATSVTQTITITATSVLNSGFSGSAVITVPALQSSGVNISPTTVTVNGLGTRQFTASVTINGAASTEVTWSASAGSIDNAGLFTAPAATVAVQTITVTVASTLQPSLTAMAVVTIPAVSGGGLVTLTPENIQAIAAEMWNTPMSAHTIEGTFGKRMAYLLTLAKFLGEK